MPILFTESNQKKIWKRLLQTLMYGHSVTPDDILLQSLYPGEDGGPDSGGNVLKVRISLMNKLLKEKTQIRIERVHNYGYYLCKDGKAISPTETEEPYCLACGQNLFPQKPSRQSNN